MGVAAMALSYVWLLCRQLLELWGRRLECASGIPDIQLTLYQAAGVEPYKVSTAAGRGLRCSRRTGLAAGTILWDEPPYAALLAVRLWRSHCQHCYSVLAPSHVGAGATTHECQQCHQVVFCSGACRAADPHHQHECDWLQRNRSKDVELTQARILIARIARRWKQNNDPPTPLDELEHLHTDHSRLGAAVVRDIVAQLGSVQELVPAAQLDESSLLNLFGRQFANACSMSMPTFTCEASRRDVCGTSQSCGLGIWRAMSLCNHSCEPNCWPQFSKGGLLSLRALRPISVGEPITISYVVQPMPFFARRQHLESVYHFSCTCVRCQQEEAEFTCGDVQTTPYADVRRAWELVQAGEAEHNAEELGNAESVFREAVALCSRAQDTNRTAATIRARALDGLARTLLPDHRWRSAIHILEQAFEANYTTAQRRSGSSADIHRWQESIDHLAGVRAMEISQLHSRCGNSDAEREWKELAQRILERTHGRELAHVLCKGGQSSSVH
eukprot:COSAG02_NODE_123_length_35269_cov_51.697526_27_plen_501_part_00